MKSDGEWVCPLSVLWACVLSIFVVSIATELYWCVSRLRAMMSLSRLNLHFPETSSLSFLLTLQPSPTLPPPLNLFLISR